MDKYCKVCGNKLIVSRKVKDKLVIYTCEKCKLVFQLPFSEEVVGRIKKGITQSEDLFN